jgi:hypothetical protein
MSTVEYDFTLHFVLVRGAEETNLPDLAFSSTWNDAAHDLQLFCVAIERRRPFNEFVRA